jgi:hypothetical protein
VRRQPPIRLIADPQLPCGRDNEAHQTKPENAASRADNEQHVDGGTVDLPFDRPPLLIEDDYGQRFAADAYRDKGLQHRSELHQCSAFGEVGHPGKRAAHDLRHQCAGERLCQLRSGLFPCTDPAGFDGVAHRVLRVPGRGSDVLT